MPDTSADGDEGLTFTEDDVFKQQEIQVLVLSPKEVKDMVVSVGRNHKKLGKRGKEAETKPTHTLQVHSPRVRPSSPIFPRATPIHLEDLSKGVPFLPEEDGVQMPLSRRFIFLLFEHPTTVVSQKISIIVFFLILLSSVSGFVESIPGFRYPNFNLDNEDSSSKTFKGINNFCMVLFVIEYMARATTAHACYMVQDMELDEHLYGQYEETAGGIYRTWVWFKQPLSLIDFFAIMPFAFQVIPGLEDQVAGAVALRYFRLIRVFRVMKLQKQTVSVSLFLNTIRKSAGPLSVLVFFLGMCIVVFGSICFNLERGNWVAYKPELAGGCSNGTDSSSAHCCGGDMAPILNKGKEALKLDDKGQQMRGCFMRSDFYGDSLERTPFVSVFMSMWWVLTTVTTVGYGDMFPTSTSGRMIGSFAMIMGVIGFAMPITIIGTTFSEEYEALTASDGEGAGLLDFFVEGAEEEPDCFRIYDTNNTGGLDVNEFKLAFHQKYNWGNKFSEVIFKEIYKRDGQSLGKQEFTNLVKMLDSMKNIFNEKFQNLEPELVVRMLEPAGLSGKKDQQRGNNEIKKYGPITIISDDQPGSLDVRSKSAPITSPGGDFQNAAPTPAPTFEAPTPSLWVSGHHEVHHENSVEYLDNRIHHRPPDYPQQLDLSSKSVQQLSTIQLLISRELCRRLGPERVSQSL